ncbi:deoxynucleoside kinase, partial [Listeria welshimeri]
ISLRGRPYEKIQDNPGLLDYYKHLHSRYDSWFASYDKSDTLVINIDEVDINKPTDAELVMKLIKEKLKR